MRDDEIGFTLIELLVIFLILAVMASIVMLAVLNLAGSTAKSACASDLQTVDNAVVAYAGQTSAQPANLASLYGTTRGTNGDTVGPWMHNVLNTGNYSIAVANGVISVTGAGSGSRTVTYTPASETASDACNTAGAS